VRRHRKNRDITPEKQGITPRYRRRRKPQKEGDGKYINIPIHVIERFVQKCAISDLSIENARRIILAMYSSGCRFGAQIGTDFLVRARRDRTGEDFVFACVPKPDEIVIKTILTVEEALINMSGQLHEFKLTQKVLSVTNPNEK